MGSNDCFTSQTIVDDLKRLMKTSIRQMKTI